jgi:uncharacterized protein YegL
MRSYSFLFPGVFALLLLFSCGKNKVSVNPDLNGDLIISIQDSFTSLPAKVSIFFKVDEKNGKPVAGLTETDFSIFEKGRNDTDFELISAFEAERKVADNSKIFSHCTILLLDLSGSVTSQSLQELKDASKSFVDVVIPVGGKPSPVKLGIWWFDGEADLHPLVSPTNDKIALKSGIDGLTPGMSADNSTNLYGAVIEGADIASSALATLQGQQILAGASVVIFTDGTDQAARQTKENAYQAVDEVAPNISFFSIGLGGEIDEAVLQRIGSGGSAFADDINSLITTFNEVAQWVKDEANSYYLFEYCSPKRDGSGLNGLRLEVEYQGKKGSRTTQFDATGFGGGCSL